MSLNRFLKTLLPFMLFVSVLSAQDKSIEEQLKKCSAGLDRYFYAFLFKKTDLQKVYQISQDLDFNPTHETDLIHSDLSKFLRDRYARRNSNGVYDSKVYKQIRAMHSFEKSVAKLDEEKQKEVIGEWRSHFLNGFVSYMRYVNSQKKRWRAMVVSQTTWDSNLNRQTEPNTTPDPTGKSDLQQMLLGNFSWTPFVNNKDFSKLWTFKQSTNFIHIRAQDHKSNEVELLDTESQFTRKVKWGLFEKAHFAFRLQKFLKSPNNTTRQVNGVYLSNRYKFAVDAKEKVLSWKKFKNTKSKTSLSYVLKKNYSWRDYTKNAKEWKFEHNQMFASRTSSSRLNTKFNYDNYETKNFASSDYKSYKLTVGYNHNAKINNFKFKMSEGIYYRHRDKTNHEKLMGFNIKGSKKIRKSLNSSLDLKYNRLDANNANANQYQLVLGFNWSI
jgi:hypothetical protein